jgi:uncharacterized damage-inducible protein DinB
MIQDIASFLNYFSSIRRRTVTNIQALPEERIDWAPQEGEFTCGDLIRHMGASEVMFAGGIATGQWRYPGHQRKAGESLETLLADLESSHAEAVDLLGRLKGTDLSVPRPSLKGVPVKTWRLLMAMVEHEVHHRSQLAVYLSLMGIQPPQIYGLSLEEVISVLTG